MLDKQRIKFLKDTVKKQKNEIDELKKKISALGMELENVKKIEENFQKCTVKYNSLIQSVEDIRHEYNDIVNELSKKK